MATIPPPRSKWESRQQWRAVRAQARAQRAAYRSQREIYRDQVRIRQHAMRRGSILGALLLIALGSVLFSVRVGALPAEQVITWYGQWWPLLLVGSGLVLLAEWAIDQSGAVDGVPYSRRSFGGGTLLLILLLAGAGAGTGGVQRGVSFLAQTFAGDSGEMSGWFGDKQQSESEFDQVLSPGATVVLTNPLGDVRVTGQSTDSHLHITLNKTVFGLSNAEMQTRSDGLNPNVRLIGTTLYIDIPSVTASSADLTVTLPTNTSTTLTSNRGKVSVAGLHSPLNIVALRGDVDLGNITGNVTVRMNHDGSSFSAHEITGDLTLNGHAEDLNISQLQGHASLQGEFFGDTHLENLHGPVVFETSRTQFHTGGVGDHVDISNGASMSARQLLGPTSLHTRNRNITFEEVSGDAAIEDRNGSVELSSTAPLGNVSIANRDGSVSLDLPPHPGVTLQAQTRDGHILNNLELTPQVADKLTTLQGKLGDGTAQVDVRTSNADITIHAPAPSSVLPAAK